MSLISSYDIAMATLLIRNLEDQVAERLRLQARLKGVSVEEEARRLLAEGTRLSRREFAAEAAAMRRDSAPTRREPPISSERTGAAEPAPERPRADRGLHRSLPPSIEHNSPVSEPECTGLATPAIHDD